MINKEKLYVGAHFIKNKEREKEDRWVILSQKMAKTHPSLKNQIIYDRMNIAFAQRT